MSELLKEGVLTRRYSCADTSQVRAEPLWGTASPAPAWLLVEEGGPWGPGSIPSSRLGEELTRQLRALAAQRSARLLLIRRPLGRPSRHEQRRVFWARCLRGSEQLLTRSAPVAALADAVASTEGWETTRSPLLLVCSHGRKDWCCALRGRPVAAALAEVAPEIAWECSHLGGDRFAASVLTLPTGVCYGRVDAAEVPELVAATRAGRVLPRLLRGRSTDSLVVQAADAMARTALGRTDVGDLVPRSARRLPAVGEPAPADARAHEPEWEVLLEAAPSGPDVVVRLRQRHWGEAVRLTCGAGQEQHARTWEPVDVREVADSAHR